MPLHSHLIVLAALVFPAAAAAQDPVSAAQGAISALLHDLEGNMIEMEGYEMNFSAWEQKAANFKVRVQDLSRRYDELNAYCQGTFDEEEYNRRLAYCDSMASQLDTLRNQTTPEAEAIDAERIELQARETRRAEAARAMFERLAQYVERMVLACIDLPPAEAGRCRIPLAPGPRTRDMVDTLNANLAGDFP